MFSVRFRLGPTIPHLLSQIRHGNIPHRRHLEPRVPSIFPGDTRPRIPPDFCLRPKAYEKARRSVDETTTSLSVHHAYKVIFDLFGLFGPFVPLPVVLIFTGDTRREIKALRI